MKRPDHYILIGQAPVPEFDLMAWARWFETADRKVAQTEIPGGVVSTIFLGLDHSFSNKGPPILFETMVFRDGGSDQCDAEGDDCWRCSTWPQAEEQHERIVKRVLAGMRGARAGKTEL